MYLPKQISIFTYVWVCMYEEREKERKFPLDHFIIPIYIPSDWDTA